MQQRRRFWQIHLSTAVVLMLAVGGLLYLNVVPKIISVDNTIELDPRLKFTNEKYGWPYEMATVLRYYGPHDFTTESKYEIARYFVVGQELRYESKPGPAAVDPGWRLDWNHQVLINTPDWQYDKAALNLIVALAALCGLVFILEFVIRREARTP
jgi:hypothetical protein